MKEIIAIREDIIKDKNVCAESYRIYTYLLVLEKDEPIDIDKIAAELNLSKRQVMKSIIRLAELGYTANLECLQ